MAIVRTQILFALAGFPGDVERPLSELRKAYPGAEYAFVARSLPKNTAKRAEHVKDVGRRVVDFIFGTKGAVSFCRSNSLPCSEEVDGKREKVRTCAADERETACYRARPKMLVFIATGEVVKEVSERFGRAALVFRCDDYGPASAENVCSIINDNLDTIKIVTEYMANLPANLHSPRMPLKNFQERAASIAEAAQADKASFAAIMQGFHEKLYDPSFKNTEKPYMRGAYLLNEKVGFQKDRLHDTAQFGNASRDDVFHLINAYHTYGFAVEPGLHFDVTEREGGTLNEVFQDILNDKESSAGDTHVNITPCDRLV
jgi:hypothetical protein